MTVTTPESVARFLRERRLAVAGVSRRPRQAANAVFRKLNKSEYEVFPINPRVPRWMVFSVTATLRPYRCDSMVS